MVSPAFVLKKLLASPTTKTKPWLLFTDIVDFFKEQRYKKAFLVYLKNPSGQFQLQTRLIIREILSRSAKIMPELS